MHVQLVRMCRSGCKLTGPDVPQPGPAFGERSGLIVYLAQAGWRAAGPLVSVSVRTASDRDPLGVAHARPPPGRAPDHRRPGRPPRRASAGDRYRGTPGSDPGTGRAGHPPARPRPRPPPLSVPPRDRAAEQAPLARIDHQEGLALGRLAAALSRSSRASIRRRLPSVEPASRAAEASPAEVTNGARRRHITAPTASPGRHAPGGERHGRGHARNEHKVIHGLRLGRRGPHPGAGRADSRSLEIVAPRGRCARRALRHSGPAASCHRSPCSFTKC